MTHPCRVCKSPYRGEIEALTKRKVNRQDIARKYYKLFNTKENLLYISISQHINKKHPPMLGDVIPLETDHKPVTNFDEFADSLLQAGSRNVLNYPEKVTPNHVIAAKRAQIEEAKLKNQDVKQKLALLRFFRGEIIEGEIDDTKQIGGETLSTNTD